MSDNADVFDISKKLAIFGPFLAAIAVCYDVGFFYGLDVAFFTFFSLAEHMVFALQALPFTLLPAFWASSYFFTSWYFERSSSRSKEEFDKQLPTMGQAEAVARLAKLNRKLYLLRTLDFFVFGVVAAYIIWLLTLHSYQAVVGTILLFILSRFFTPAQQSPTNRLLWMTFMVFGVLMLSFATGYERADKILSQPQPTETISIEKEDIPAKVIRGGERGVLFLATNTRQLKFVRWDAIKGIETVKP